MPVVQCGPNINCIGVDSPVANLSAELPDVPKCFRYAFTAQSEYVCEFDLSLCEAFSGVGSDVGLLCSPPPQIIDYQNPPPVLVYSSNVQRCTVDCGGFSETYEVVAGTFVGLSQASADAAAHAFACELATILCTGPLPTIYTNTAQSCTVTCPNQTQFTYTTPAGFFSALSQSDANLQAFLFACELAALLCPGLPPIGTVTSAGNSPPVPNEPLYGNFAQACSATCPDGSTFTYVVPGGTYFRESRLAANAVAFSLACNQANRRRVCLSDLERAICADTFYGEFLDATGLTAPITFAIVSGSLPTGITLDDNFLQGVPTIAGDYTFAIRAMGSDGSYAQRTYTQTVGDVSPDLLPDGAINTPYAEALTADGFSSPTFAVADGALPDGLTLQPSTGVISGTPTTGGDFDFTIQVSDGASGLTCEKNYVVTISGAIPAVWYRCESVEPIVDAVAGNNMVRDLGSGTAPVATTGGKVALGVYSETTGDQCVFKTGQIAALAPTGEDMHFFGWVQITPPVLQKDQLYQQFDYAAAGGQALAFRFVGDGSYLVFDNSNVIFSGAIGTIPANVWTFWHLKVDGATGNFEFSLNNAASASLPTDFSPAADVTGDFEVLFLYNQAEAGVNTKMDEVAIFIGAMTQAEVDGIYNSGNGRTYP